MGLRATVAVVLALSASAAVAQPSPAPTPLNPTPPGRVAGDPIPPAPAVANGRGPLPKIVQPKPERRAMRRPRGQPIVQGNTDIYVDSYGQLSTTMQP